ncbi:hypothetical protein EJB05_03318 [Eragrostis curvula]|uniref:X8 domain-containing protein n=1 Tax=Eragrostis curvula TaxID=38414 RepID=A0A5J9W6Y8_9POAL|nr:hypothetical protein EJB05_03318 [Eragrostis curvula]
MAAARPHAIAFFLCFLCSILLQTICTSGAFLDFSYDSKHGVIPSSSVTTEYRVLVTEKQKAYVFLKPFECRARPCRTEHLAGSLVSQVLVPNQHLNFSNVIITATETQLGALRRTLQSVHASLGAAGLNVSVSPELSLSSLRNLAKNRVGKRQWGKVLEFVRRSGSFVQVEMDVEVNDELAVAAAMEAAVADLAALSGVDAGVVLRLKSWEAPSAVAMAKLVGEMSREKRILGVLVDASSSPPRRELAEARAAKRDDVTNPVTVPATNPTTSPMSPGIVTVPSTNPPGMGFASNPNLPPLYPVPTPTPVTMPDPTTTMPSPTVPDMNPVTAPATMPGTVTNPATTPSSPVTNPATTYPGQQQGGGVGVGVGTGGGMPTTPVYQPPATMPGTVQQPAAPAVSGQTWCVAKTGLSDMVMQNGIDYACGIGGADCSAIQPMGSCYNPNTVQAHASYAFNSYFQRNPSPASCDFGGAGMLVNVNPSSGTCMYQTSSGFSAGSSSGVTGTVPTGYIPGMTGTGPAGTPFGGGGGTGSTVLNANNPGGNSMYGGSDPTSLTSGSASLSCGWVLCLIWMITFAFVKEKV